MYASVLGLSDVRREEKKRSSKEILERSRERDLYEKFERWFLKFLM